MSVTRIREQVSLVGGESLLGEELSSLIRRTMPSLKVHLAGIAEEGDPAQRDEDPVVLTPLDAERLAASRVIILAGSADAARKTLGMIRGGGGKPYLIDLTTALEDLPESRVTAPTADAAAGPPARVMVIAHPAASVLSAFLPALHHAFVIRGAVAQIFEPASERGRAGVRELQQQAVQLLSFQKLPEQVFGAQLSFNMLPCYGGDAPLKLEEVEQRVERHMASLLAGRVPFPSVRVLQAPVMHGHAISIWVDFVSRPEPSALAELFEEPRFDYRGPDVEAPHPVGMAGQTGIGVGRIEADRNHRTGMWFWLAADNHRVQAMDAVAAVRMALDAGGGA